MDDTMVTVPNPDDPMGMPIYDGRADEAYKYLVGGLYDGVAADVDGDFYDVIVVVIDENGPNVPSLGLYPTVNRSSFHLQREACPLGCDIADPHEHTVQYYVGYPESHPIYN